MRERSSESALSAIGASAGPPAVTVIIPTFDRAAFIEDAIDSVLAQTMSQSEIVVVDDGSVDDTSSRLKRYGDRITYVRTDHGGPAHARNVGMRLARGKYLAFLDSDDLYYPYKLELQVRVMDRFPDIGMTYTECSAFDDAGFWAERHLRSYHASGFRGIGPGYDGLFDHSIDLAKEGFLGGLPVSGSAAMGSRAYFGNIFDVYVVRLVVFTNSMMLRRDLLPQVGLQDESLKLFEELDFALRICRRHRVGFLDIPTYKLRYHSGQMSTTTGPRGHYAWIRKQQVLRKVVKRAALGDAAYYSSHRRRLDQHLAHLCRAVAIPLMLFSGGTAATRRRYARRARRYLTRCRMHGQSEALLWALTYAPGPLRRLGVTVFEKVRKAVPASRGHWLDR